MSKSRHCQTCWYHNLDRVYKKPPVTPCDDCEVVIDEETGEEDLLEPPSKWEYEDKEGLWW